MLNSTDTGIIIVDIQGKLADLVHDQQAVRHRCECLIQAARIFGLPIVWLEQNPAGLGDTVSDIRQHLDGFSPISKTSFNACEELEFVEAVNQANVSSWLLCGIEAHICVYQTAAGLAKLGYHVECLADCVASREDSNRLLALEKMRLHGVSISSLEMSLYELLEDCQTPAFKAILNLIR
ncbi:isochorismatase family protein [Vibrio sp.]|uniref:isochorismatase family protein n=1 Tax=Vibrio sp. TaxID=678 RepID=UPI003D104CEB